MSTPWGILTGIRPVKIMRGIIKSKTNNPVQEFIDKYNVSNKKADLAFDIANRELDILKNIKDNEIGLYIGIPFCRTRCLYCSFVTHTAVNIPHLQRPYVSALKKEIAYSKEIIDKLNLKVVRVYIGGGTPTALSADLINEVMSSINKHFPNILEYTVEAGRADTIDKEKLKTIKANGATRICINPQTMNDDILKYIGRKHTSVQLIESFKLARNLGFDNINMDLIAGLPKDNLKSFKTSIEKVCDLNPEAITVHSMSIKRGSRLQEELNNHKLTDGYLVKNMVDFASEYLNKLGYNPYYLYRQKNILGDLENVGYAKSGFESLYNIMMMEEVATIISVGAGGVTKIINSKDNSIHRLFNYKEAQNYIYGLDEIFRRKDKILKKY